ncbi:MAG: hypothetical protein K2H44_02135 [Muribaculaceae bacterium]|nr:hypothetical protein [Muribaculaceae bacterium]
MVSLYKTPRTYFDHICSEYQNYPVREKLLDIGYATWHGHDIMDDIKYIIDNYSYVSVFDIRLAIRAMRAELNHVSMYDIPSSNHNTIEDDVKIFIEELMKYYRLPKGGKSEAYLADDSSRIYINELEMINGWTEALNRERQAYQMYSYGHWIMFPGDGEIIRNFNINFGEQNKGYISYVYPEPWYGAPTSAKIIVLGSDVHYNDKISRIQNQKLSKDVRRCESIQLTVDRWLDLMPDSFCRILNGDGQTVHDIYNSPTYRFWWNKISDMAEYIDVPLQELFDSIAVINANPYTALNVNPLEPGLLPSHYFLRQIIRYVVNHNPNVLFLLPAERLRKTWKTILGDVYDDIMAQDRIITGGVKHIDLSKGFTSEQIDRLHKAIVR